MSPGPPSTAPSTRWPGPPNNDYAVRWRTAPAIWLGRPEPVLGDPGRHAIDPAWRRRHRNWPLGGGLGGRLCRTRRPVVATVRSAERRPGRGRSLRERWECGTCWLCAPPWSWPRSTIDADRVDQMCAQSAAQSARRPVNWPAAHRIPTARRWLICTLYAACVRWSAARARCHGHPVTEPWSPGRMVAFGSPWLSLCITVKRPPPRRECARRGPSSHPPAKPRGRDHARHRRPGPQCNAPAPSPTSARMHAGPCVATVGPDSRAWVCSFSKAT